MKKFGLIGCPISHSKSPEFFNNKFSKEGIDAVYDLYELDSIQQLPELLKSDASIVGLNVTSPWKIDVMQFCDNLTPEATSAGAVNTLLVSNSDDNAGGKIAGKLIQGHNTDVVGFRQSLLKCLEDNGFIPAHKPLKALIMGTGGASSAVQVALRQLGIYFELISRRKGPNTHCYDDLAPENIRSCDIIINATPMGMGELTEIKPPLPYEAISAKHLCYDLIYAPAETAFLKECRSRGAKTANGRGMLNGQAEAAWEFWQSHK